MNSSREQGFLYVYDRDSAGEWIEVDIMPGPDAGDNEGFGYDVALDGSQLLAGAHGDSNENGEGAGSIFLHLELEQTSKQLTVLMTTDSVDSCELEDDPSLDCNGDGVLDNCQLIDDCNANGVLDECDIADGGGSNDANGNGIPDECEDDCNTNGVPDHWDIKTGTSEDCNTNGIPDECDTADGGGSNDVNGNSIPDECEADCNDNGSPDDWDVIMGWSEDCNDNLIPDECDLEVQIPEGAVQWTVEEGGNGNWYKAIIHGDLPFAQAQDIALSMGARLASVTSPDEADFINLYVAADSSLWTHDMNGCFCIGPYIGGFRDAGGDWQWLDGSAWSWTNWHPGNPDGPPNQAMCLRLWDFCCKRWQDNEQSGDGQAVISSILEWDVGSLSLDCNINGIPDECDIADETSEDINGDGVPDECQCLADIDGSGAVTIDDLLAVIGYWGSSNPAADVNSDGIVNITDLLFIFDQWGPCP